MSNFSTDSSVANSNFREKKMKKYRMSGKVNVGCLFLIILVIAGGYLGFKFGEVYVARWMFDRKLFEIAGEVAGDYESKTYPNNRVIADEVIEEARKLSIDITHDDIRIKRGEGTATINVTWEGDVVIPRYTYHFVYEFEAVRKVDF